MLKPTTPADLDDYAQKLRDHAQQLRAVARVMEEEKIKTMEVNNRAMADRAITHLDDFYDWLKRALRNEQKARRESRA